MGGKKRRGECVFLAGPLTQRSWVRILHITSWFRGAVKLHSDKGVRLKGGSRQKREHKILIKIPKILNKYQEVNIILHLPFNFKWNALFGQLRVLWRGSVTRFSTPSWVKKKTLTGPSMKSLIRFAKFFCFHEYLRKNSTSCWLCELVVGVVVDYAHTMSMSLLTTWSPCRRSHRLSGHDSDNADIDCKLLTHLTDFNGTIMRKKYFEVYTPNLKIWKLVCSMLKFCVHGLLSLTIRRKVNF